MSNSNNDNNENKKSSLEEKQQNYSSDTIVQLISTVLDGASERAVLMANDGTVLHMNGAARHFLYTPPPSNTKNNDNKIHVTDFLVCPPGQDWRQLQHCRVVMKNGSMTRTERNIHMSQLPPNSDDDNSNSSGGDPQQQQQHYYYTAYICSKHERVREVVDHAFDPVLTIDEKGIICTANEAASELFGYTEGELVGHNVKMICGGGHAEHHDQYMKQYMETGIAKVLGRRREVLAKKKCGAEFPCQLGVQEISDASSGKRYFCGFFKDLTLLKQHEAELQERQELAQGMIDASFDCMLEVDSTGVIKVVNDAACNMFGYTRDEFLGSNISIICGDGHADKHDSYMQRYMESGEKHIIGRKRQVKARRKDGSEVLVELGVQEVILSTSGEKTFCGYIRDLTERQKDKRALRKQAQVIHNKFFGGEQA